MFVGKLLGHRLRRWKNKKHGKKPLEKVWESGAQARANCKHCKSFTGRFDKINAGCTKINRARTLAHYGAQSVLTMRHVHTSEEFTVAWARCFGGLDGADVDIPMFSAIPWAARALQNGHFPVLSNEIFFSEYYNLGSVEMELMDPQASKNALISVECDLIRLKKLSPQKCVPAPEVCNEGSLDLCMFIISNWTIHKNPSSFLRCKLLSAWIIWKTAVALEIGSRWKSKTMTFSTVNHVFITSTPSLFRIPRENIALIPLSLPENRFL